MPSPTTCCAMGCALDSAASLLAPLTACTCVNAMLSASSLPVQTAVLSHPSAVWQPSGPRWRGGTHCRMPWLQGGMKILVPAVILAGTVGLARMNSFTVAP